MIVVIPEKNSEITTEVVLNYQSGRFHGRGSYPAWLR